jgi:hypothetical protein
VKLADEAGKLPQAKINRDDFILHLFLIFDYDAFTAGTPAYYFLVFLTLQLIDIYF